MALPRSKYVRDGQEGVYHCFNRCVRRAFLCGFDATTGRDFSHRKVWMVDRLRQLSAIFAIEVCAYSIMMNHYHLILRVLPDLVALWSDREVAIRWLTLFPHHGEPPTESQICALVNCSERIAQLRRRLGSLSWFMAGLDEFIARAANKEDHVKGRFWESRFKCQALLDDAAIAACMVYVDLNLIRAGLATTPEDSDFTSIQERIRAWYKETTTHRSSESKMPNTEDATELSNAIPEYRQANAPVDPTPSTCWLCPIQSDASRRGILDMTDAEYFDLVDRSGRILRADKRGAIDPDLVPILLRIQANPKQWQDTISFFGSRFRLAAGLLSNLRHFANQLGRQWLTGVASARAAFSASPPQSA